MASVIDLAQIDSGAAKSVVENMWKIYDGIEETFGKGYAKTHPELVSDMVKAASIDFLATVIHYNLQELTEVISNLKTDEREE